MPTLHHFYTPVEDGTYYGITHGGQAGGRAGGQAGGRRPLLCPEHISKTILATVMKFHGWIDLIKGECSAQESQLLFPYFFSYCPLFFFILEFSLVNISKTILPTVIKFHACIHLIKGECSAQES